jgi:hypothetical protein
MKFGHEGQLRSRSGLTFRCAPFSIPPWPVTINLTSILVHMNLSERAVQYIKTLKRDNQYVSNEDETRDYLARQGIAPYQQFVNYQVNYSGYQLTINGDPGHSFSCRLFSKKQIQKNEGLDIIRTGVTLVHECGDHRTAQFNFFLTDRGELCTLDDSNLPNVLNSSFDKLVEEYAFRNEISHWDSNPYYFEVWSPEGLKAFMENRFNIIEECSDSFATWWTNNQIVAVKGVWLDRPEFYFHVYGTARKLCDDLIVELKRENILKK